MAVIIEYVNGTAHRVASGATVNIAENGGLSVVNADHYRLFAAAPGSWTVAYVENEVTETDV